MLDLPLDGSGVPTQHGGHQRGDLVRGRQAEDKSRHFLHRGIAARQFQRAFLLAEGMDVLGADLSNGLLSIDLARPEPERIVRKITIAGDKA